MKYRLGLDIGTSSLGWSVLETKETGTQTPCRIVAAGSRIFSEGRNVKDLSTLAAGRRLARSARRRRDRFKQRQGKLIRILTNAGLFPKDSKQKQELQKLNPLKLRSKALTDKLKPEEIGRALFHLNQRRGFSSNRRATATGDKKEQGVVYSSVRELLKEMQLVSPSTADSQKPDINQGVIVNAVDKLKQRNDLSYGSFLYQRNQEHKQTRARPGAGKDKKLYDVYPTRELYKDEFSKIWTSQVRFYPALLTDSLRQSIANTIFYQRPLKPQVLGKCSYISAEDRTFKAMPSFQRYRIYQELNNLTWTTSSGIFELRNHPEAQALIVDEFEKIKVKSGQIVWSKIKTILQRLDLIETDFRFNLESEKRKGLDGNLTSRTLQKVDYVGAQWHKWQLDKQDEFVAVILNGTPKQQAEAKNHVQHNYDSHADEQQLTQYLMAEYDLEAGAAQKCALAPLRDETANISLQAARFMLAKMCTVNEQGRLPNQYEAATMVAQEKPEFIDPMRTTKGTEKFIPKPSLPYYGKAFAEGEAFAKGSHIIPGGGHERDQHDDRKFFGGISNPTVHIALNQIRQVVNELINIYGHPDSIAIELARELPYGKDKRREIEREQKDNQEKNEELNKKLTDLLQPINTENRLRLRLWEELNNDNCNDRRCPFSGQKIGMADLFSARVEIEHLIPYSKSLDDSRANKVVAMRSANRDKGNRTPYEAFGDSPAGYGWEEIFARSEKLPAAKRWRFQKNALDIWNKDHKDFTARHLNDTRYIGRLAREYLELICDIDKIDVLTGRLTGKLRSNWGLNSILKRPNLDEKQGLEEATEKTKAQKNRADHRHHALDAIVIGMVTKSLIQKVATVAKRAEEQDLARFIEQKSIDPWPSFRHDVEHIMASIVVSHRTKRKQLGSGTTDGQLHNETAYGIVKKPEKSVDLTGTQEDLKAVSAVVVRKEVAWFDSSTRIQQIRDPDLREKFLSAFKQGYKDKKGEEGVKELATYEKIRSLRCVENLRVIGIKDQQTGSFYKAYKPDSNWGVEIFEVRDEKGKKDIKWQAVCISRYAANRPDFKLGETFRPHPASRLIMRLQINDYIELDSPNAGKKRRLMRVQKLSQATITLAPPNEANVSARDKDKQDSFNYETVSGNQLKSMNARKVHISPTGLMSVENRHRPRRNQAPKKD